MSAIEITQLEVGGFDKNFSYIITHTDSHEGLIVDPCGSVARVIDTITEKKIIPKGVLITHTHFDHHDGLGDILNTWDVPVYMHELGTRGTAAEEAQERLLRHEDVIQLGDSEIKAFYTPGHYIDCCCYFLEKDITADGIPALITGDTLFVEGCGRTLEKDVETLYNSLLFLKTFPDETKVYAGHNYGSIPVSTIAHEKKHNKYFLAQNLDEFRTIRLGN